jgi:hypothetical protein
MNATQTAHLRAACEHLRPLLEDVFAAGGHVGCIEEGYTETHRVFRVSQAPHMPRGNDQPAVSPPLEYFESFDPHYHPVPEAGIVCRACRQAIAWDQ